MGDASRVKTLFPQSMRGQQWVGYAEEVLEHVENYTVPQYGDMPDDQASAFTSQDILREIARYVNRNIRGNARGHECALMDSLKIGHYASMLREKLINEELFCDRPPIEMGM